MSTQQFVNKMLIKKFFKFLCPAFAKATKYRRQHGVTTISTSTMKRHQTHRHHRRRQARGTHRRAPATWWNSTRPAQAHHTVGCPTRRLALKAWSGRRRSLRMDRSTRQSTSAAATLIASQRETSRDSNQFYGWNWRRSSTSTTSDSTSESHSRGSERKRETFSACRSMRWFGATNKSREKIHRWCHSSFKASCESSSIAVLRRKESCASPVISRR